MTTENKKVMIATASGLIFGYINDQAGRPIPIRVHTLVVRRLGHKLFSPSTAIGLGVSTILETGTSHIQFDDNPSLLTDQCRRV